MSAPCSPNPPEIAAAYAFCRAIAKREAKNFYYAFRVLPRHKSDAMCAVYAFMRKADDLSDDESMTLPERRESMAKWTAKWRDSRRSVTSDPVFLALKDTQARFGISDDLLEQLVAGTTLDLVEQPEGVRNVTLQGGGQTRAVQIYEAQEALEHYCYLVASVVGLVCIRIFGYSDPRAEQFAVNTGIAFQITNILRDVREDVERGRVYLPLKLFEQCGVEPGRLLELTNGNSPSSKDLELLGVEERRAEDLYRSANELIPLLDADSRPAMNVLAEIYHRLLRRIAADPAVVFRERVSVPTATKLAILGRGVVASLFARGRA